MTRFDFFGKSGKKQTPSNEEGTGAGAKCLGCGELLAKMMLETNLNVCASCGHHHKLSAPARLKQLLDSDTFNEHDADLASRDILDFKAAKRYTDKLAEAQKNTNLLSAILTGTGKLVGRTIAIGVSDGRFIMGSMGSVVGEKITRLAEYALAEKIPLLLVSGSGGGARMYEGLYSLMQMAKTSAALGKLHQAGIPYLSLVTDSTMAGIWASWASLGDVIIAEPKALVGFTGPRVIKTTINAELPEGFQRSEFLLQHGQLDMIVPRDQLRTRLASILNLLCGEVETVPAEGA